MRDIHVVIKKIKKCEQTIRAHYSEVVILIKLLLIAPAVNAVSVSSCFNTSPHQNLYEDNNNAIRIINTVMLITYKAGPPDPRGSCFTLG